MKAANLVLAYKAWAPDFPHWIEILARACDASSQTAVAADLGYSRTAICLLINRKYDRDLTEIERAVRTILMDTRVNCPVLGQIRDAECAEHQESPLSTANPQAVALYRACRSGCIHAISKERKAS